MRQDGLLGATTTMTRFATMFGDRFTVWRPNVPKFLICA
jgi:hypothetical protein